MPNPPDRSPKPPPLTVPAGAPQWITVELLEHTIRIWQPFYPDQLISEDALEIIMGADRMFELLSKGHGDETIRCTGESQQS